MIVHPIENSSLGERAEAAAAVVGVRSPLLIHSLTIDPNVCNLLVVCMYSQTESKAAKRTKKAMANLKFIP